MKPALVDALDRALSLEGADLDRDGAWESIAGLIRGVTGTMTGSVRLSC